MAPKCSIWRQGSPWITWNALPHVWRMTSLLSLQQYMLVWRCFVCVHGLWQPLQTQSWIQVLDLRNEEICGRFQVFGPNNSDLSKWAFWGHITEISAIWELERRNICKMLEVLAHKRFSHLAQFLFRVLDIFSVKCLNVGAYYSFSKETTDQWIWLLRFSFPPREAACIPFGLISSYSY